MGCFSFICKNSELAVASSSGEMDSDSVRLYLLKNGKVIEEMRGIYDSYGSVFDGKGGSFNWDMNWDDICDDLLFSDDSSNGIAAILECYFDGEIPTTRSDRDPEQGWGKCNGKGYTVEPIHISISSKRDEKLVDLGIK